MAKRKCLSCDKRLKKTDAIHEVWVNTHDGKHVVYLCKKHADELEALMEKQELERHEREDG